MKPRAGGEAFLGAGRKVDGKVMRPTFAAPAVFCDGNGHSAARR
jgi:hypothetical protein